MRRAGLGLLAALLLAGPAAAQTELPVSGDRLQVLWTPADGGGAEVAQLARLAGQGRS